MTAILDPSFLFALTDQSDSLRDAINHQWRICFLWTDENNAD